ncbi:MAG: hypothetical protein Q4F23_00070 [Coriobacteriia bacterium]|nr:hypothetical protein [Coriobacteriia bacterium]
MAKKRGTWLPLAGGKATPKKFFYGNEKIARVCDSALADEAELTQRSISSVIEQCIVERFFPGDEAEKAYLTRLYDDGVKEAVLSLLDDESIGTGFRSRHQGNLELVDGLISVARTKGIVAVKPTPYLVGQLDSVVTAIAQASERADDPLEKQTLASEAAFGRGLLAEANDGRQQRLDVILQMARRNWNSVRGLSVTYRLLFAAVEAAEDWEDSAYDRRTIATAIEAVTANWTAEEANRKN